MDDKRNLMAAISGDDKDDNARLVYADWHDEQGAPGRGDFIRMQVATEVEYRQVKRLFEKLKFRKGLPDEDKCRAEFNEAWGNYCERKVAEVEFVRTHPELMDNFQREAQLTHGEFFSNPLERFFDQLRSSGPITEDDSFMQIILNRRHPSRRNEAMATHGASRGEGAFEEIVDRGFIQNGYLYSINRNLDELRNRIVELNASNEPVNRLEVSWGQGLKKGILDALNLPSLRTLHLRNGLRPHEAGQPPEYGYEPGTLSDLLKLPQFANVEITASPSELSRDDIRTEAAALKAHNLRVITQRRIEDAKRYTPLAFDQHGGGAAEDIVMESYTPDNHVKPREHEPIIPGKGRDDELLR